MDSVEHDVEQHQPPAKASSSETLFQLLLFGAQQQWTSRTFHRLTLQPRQSPDFSLSRDNSSI